MRLKLNIIEEYRQSTTSEHETSIETFSFDEVDEFVKGQTNKCEMGKEIDARLIKVQESWTTH